MSGIPWRLAPYTVSFILGDNKCLTHKFLNRCLVPLPAVKTVFCATITPLQRPQNKTLLLTFLNMRTVTAAL